MTNWYREPKRVKLMEHLARTGVGFVLSSDEFSESDLRNLKAMLQPIGLDERLTLGTATPGDHGKVLIIAPKDYQDPNWLRNPELWAGIFILPGHRHQRENALRVLFTINRSSTMAHEDTELSARASFTALFLT